MSDAPLEPRLHAEPMSNWNSDCDYDEGWNAALRAAGKFWGFEPRYSDWTLWLKAQREAPTSPVASSPVGGEQQ
jgi:hypothetical protein